MNLIRRHGAARAALIVFAALGVSLALAAPASASTGLDAANRAFAEGHFADAAAQYESIVAREGYSAPVLFDLGNAYQRQDKPALAILAYERAKLLAPRDAAITENLETARKAAGVSDDSGMLDRVTHRLTDNEWTWLATAAFWLAAAGAAGAWLFPRGRTWLVRAATAGALVGAVAAVGLVSSMGEERAALAIRAAPVLVSPFDGAQSSFSLRPGSGVEIQRAHEGYVLVRDGQGRSGWVEHRAIARLVGDESGASLGG